MVRKAESCFRVRLAARVVHVRVLVHVRSFAGKVLFKVRAHLQWCVTVKCSGASDAVARDYKKGLETPQKGNYVCLKN